MTESLCKICPISAARVLRRSDAGIIAVPDHTVRPGHVMVVSTTHAASFSDMKPVEADAFMALVASAARAAEQASGAERYYIVRIGDKAPHLHFHLVPRAEGEPSLAPFVFGEDGWATHARGGAMPPVDLFEQAFMRELRLESVTHRAVEDAGRLPPALVRLGLSLTALTLVMLVTWPTLGPDWSGPLGLAAGLIAGHASEDRMRGRPIRWFRTLAIGTLGSVLATALIRWL